MIWYLLLLVLSSPAHSTKNIAQLNHEIHFESLAPGNSEFFINDLPDRTVQGRFSISQDFGTRSFPHSSLSGILSNQPDFHLTISPSSRIGACSTKHSDETSSDIFFHQVSHDKTVVCDTVPSAPIEHPPLLALFPEIPSFGTASCSSMTDCIMVGNHPNGPSSFSPMSQTGARTTFNSDRDNPNMGYFSDQNECFDHVVSGSKTSKSGQCSINRVKDSPLKKRARFAYWPRTHFHRATTCQIVSKAPLIDLELFVNSKRNSQILKMSWPDVRSAVVIAIGNCIQNNGCRLPDHETLLSRQTLQFAEFIVGHVMDNHFDQNYDDVYNVDKNWQSCFKYCRLTTNPKTAEQNSALTDINHLNLTPCVKKVLSLISVAYRYTYLDGYHHPLLTMVWNACVKLLEMYGHIPDDYVEYMKVGILDQMLRRRKQHNTTRLEPAWDRNPYTESNLIRLLSRVLQRIAYKKMTIGPHEADGECCC